MIVVMVAVLDQTLPFVDRQLAIVTKKNIVVVALLRARQMYLNQSLLNVT
jgi:hypothetical protein